MKITIKNYRSCRANEGDAYSCTLYLDGKRAALVEYGGTGGPVEFDFRAAAGAANKWHSGPVFDAFQAYCKTLPPLEYPHDDPNDPSPAALPRDMEIVVGEAVEKMLEHRDMKRHCRTKVVFRYEGAPRGEYQMAKGRWTGQETGWREQIAKWASDDGKVVAEIVNERFAA